MEEVRPEVLRKKSPNFRKKTQKSTIMLMIWAALLSRQILAKNEVLVTPISAQKLGNSQNATL